jgi:hypothetical protein
MANVSLLFCSDHEGVPQQGRDDIAFFGRYQIPLFWLASARTKDIQYVVDDVGDKLPYLDVEKRQMIQTFQGRAEVLSAIADGMSDYFERWTLALERFDTKYIKVDPTEIIFMVEQDPTEFERAVRFFEEPSDAGFMAILSVTCLTDVLEQRPLRIRKNPIVLGERVDVSSEVYLIGYTEAGGPADQKKRSPK